MRDRLRDKIEPEDDDINMNELRDAWVNNKLTTEDELRNILRRAYAGMEAPHQREAHRIIERAADLCGPHLVVAEEALEAARQSSMLKAITIAEDMKNLNGFAISEALRREMEKRGQ